MRLRKLIRLYQKDPLSRWHGLRYATRRNHRNLLRQIDRRHGHVRLKKIKGRTLLKWHADWLDGHKFSSAHAFIKKLRAVLGFGLTILEDRECARIRQVMSSLRFPGTPKRKQRVTADQAQAIIAVAHRKRCHSIALAQAFQFELMLRQKDVIGEWLPLKEEGEAYLVDGKSKWLRGLLWEEIDADFILRHRTSKTGKVAVFDLKLAPMVMAELARLKRQPERGPVIVEEETAAPFRSWAFRRAWRSIARAAKVPDDVFNMDSRAGGISEAFEAEANPDFIRVSATHSELSTTQGYNRGEELASSKAVARARVKRRNKSLLTPQRRRRKISVQQKSSRSRQAEPTGMKAHVTRRIQRAL